MGRLLCGRAGVLVWLVMVNACDAEEHLLHSFRVIPLTDEYYSEGVGAGDLNGDGIADVVYGPLWYAGPDYQKSYELAEPVPQNREKYADRFFSWVYDFDGDGWNDVLVVGFPGKPAYVYQNPGPEGLDKHWKKHEVCDWVSNEAPQLVDIVGNERPELVCTRDGYFGFATVNWDAPFSPWKFHQISEPTAASQFGHGLGIGDVNGDGRMDVLHKGGWLEQPVENPLTSRWQPHEVSFSLYNGGAEMYVFDVDGDGDNDVITSHAAHDFGLGWYEQVQEGEDVTFVHHLIMGSHPSENAFGLVFSELHSVAVADINGDGKLDIITGKTFYSHRKKSPMWDAGAVVYWFEWSQDENGEVLWIPHLAAEETGIGRQITIHDVDGDGLLDIVVGGMKGANILIHQTASVDEETWRAAQPKRYSGPKLSELDSHSSRRGPKSNLTGTETNVPGADEAEHLSVFTTHGNARQQTMKTFQQDRWSGNSQLFWTGGRTGDELRLSVKDRVGTHQLQAVLTCAPDYGIVEILCNGKQLGEPIDLYEPTVRTTGVLTFPDCELTGDDVLSIRLVGNNPKAKPLQYVGIDYLSWTPSTDGKNGQ